MLPVSLHDKAEIAAFLRRTPWLHMYHLGDLDDFFWPYTAWYASKANGKIDQLILLYHALDVPVLLAVSEDAPAMSNLVKSLIHLLPRRIYTHLSAGVQEAFAADYHIEPNGLYYKMKLTDPPCLDKVDTSATFPLSPADQADVQTLFNESYPGNWFDPRMLETGCYYGIRQDGKLVCVAGVHVYSPEYRVAALGNITTHPAYRGQGLASAASARVCRELLATTNHIGLNVNQENASALACYKRLGFEIAAEYSENMLTIRESSLPPVPHHG
jgi:ribosomal protein S18 acetylase RimI-like enzyme